MDTTAAVAPPYVVKPFTLHAFRGLMLAPSRVGDPASARAFSRPYRDVPARILAWQATRRIRRDSAPALYLHEYTADGVTVRGLVGALDLTRTSSARPPENQAVFPHEGVHPPQVRELAKRMHAMAVNPAPILLVHRGPHHVRRLFAEAMERQPDFGYADRAGQMQRVWAIRDHAVLSALAEALASSHALIADGHHRYAAYLRLQQEHPGTAWDRGLAMLVDQSDTPLWLGPIHRFLGGLKLADLEASARRDPTVTFTRRGQHDALARLGEATLVLSDAVSWATLELQGPVTLPVSSLQHVLVPRWAPTSVSYHHTADEALAHARSERGVCVLLPSPGFDAVVDAAASGALLPEKATSFQPKPSLGVLMRNLRDE